MKIFNRENRDSLGRYTYGFFRKLWNAIKLTGALLLAIGLVSAYCIAFLGSHDVNYTSDPYIKLPHAEAKESLDGKIAELRIDVIDRLEKCEKGQYEEKDGVVRIDNNKAGTLTGMDVFSFGVLQWKTNTVKNFVKIRNNKVITTKEAVELALNRDEARALADYTIFETQGGIYNWLNCAEGNDLIDEVTVIKKLMK